MAEMIQYAALGLVAAASVLLGIVALNVAYQVVSLVKFIHDPGHSTSRSFC